MVSSAVDYVIASCSPDNRLPDFPDSELTALLVYPFHGIFVVIKIG